MQYLSESLDQPTIDKIHEYSALLDDLAALQKRIKKLEAESRRISKKTSCRQVASSSTPPVPGSSRRVGRHNHHPGATEDAPVRKLSFSQPGSASSPLLVSSDTSSDSEVKVLDRSIRLYGYVEVSGRIVTPISSILSNVILLYKSDKAPYDIDRQHINNYEQIPSLLEILHIKRNDYIAFFDCGGNKWVFQTVGQLTMAQLRAGHCFVWVKRGMRHLRDLDIYIGTFFAQQFSRCPADIK